MACLSKNQGTYYFGLIALLILCLLSTHINLADAADGVAFLPSTSRVSNSPRVALVIGNGAYMNVPRLKNTVGDADAVASKLRNLGYEVQYAQNVNRRAMNEAITSFLARLEPGMEATVYYAGHGVELNGANFLLPTDVPALDPEQERMLRTEGVNVNDLLLDITDRHAAVTLVILDACRDNPFHTAGTYGSYRSLGSTRGLANVAPPRGSFVIFSAGAGEEALDNLGGADPSPNGLFTRKLLALMDKDGLELRELVRELRVEVSDAAAATPDHHSQVPGYYDQMLGDFYFHPKNVMTGEADLTKPKLLNSEAVSKVLPQPQLTPQSLIPQPQETEKLQKLASLPPSVEISRPVLCQSGEELRGGVCQLIACAAGTNRNNAGVCVRRMGQAQHKTYSIKRDRPRIVSPVEKTRFKSVAALTSHHKSNCFRSGSMTYCE